jgi:hypothetical protein
MCIPFATPQFLMQYPQSVNDYRCAINADASILIFERTILGSGDGAVRLYRLDLTPPDAEPTLFGSAPATRPDWCWASNQIAYNTQGGIVIVNGLQIFVGPSEITKGMIYPAWYPGGGDLVVYNTNPNGALPVPRSSKINLDYDMTITIARQNMANDQVWAGMPSVNPANSNLIAFAGQLIAGQTHYDQDKNYIWLADNSTPPTVKPLDPDATGPFNSAYQGRAPWWSPNGEWIAFESDRTSSNGQYAIFIQPSDGSKAAVQVTDYEWNANHAKWYPNGTELVVSVNQQPNKGPRGIARLDVSTFVS